MEKKTLPYHPALSVTYGLSPAGDGSVESTPLHSDTYHRLVFVVSGEVTATTGSGAVYGSVRQHTGHGVIFYRKDQPHSQMNHLTVPYERYYFDFEDAFWEGMLSVCPPLAELLAGDSFFLPLTEAQFSELYATVRAILRLMGFSLSSAAEKPRRTQDPYHALEDGERPDPVWEIRVLLSSVLLRAVAMRKEKRMPGKYIPYIDDVMTYMDTYYAEKITIERLTEVFHVSRGKLTADFKAASLSTINDHLTAVRLDRAAHLLLEGRSVTETAALCGFATAEYFINVFRTHNGTTPKQFGQLCGGNQLSLEWEYWD